MDKEEILAACGKVLKVIFIGIAAIVICSPLVIISVGVSLPLLLLTLLATRVVQPIRNGEDDSDINHVKIWVRSCLFVVVIVFLVIMGIFQGIVRTVPSLKHGTLVGVPISKWITIVSMLCGFYQFSYALFLFQFGGRKFVMNSASQEALTEIADCLIFWWAEHEVMERVPHLQAKELLGLRVQKWIEISLFVLIGYNIITLFTESVVGSIRLVTDTLRKRDLFYYVHGLRRNVNFLLISLLLLLTWVLYFGSRLSKTSGAQSVVRFGTLTFLSLFIFSFLCLLKDVLVLSWEAQAIYNRLERRILKARKQLYFLGIISRHYCDIFRLLYIPENVETKTLFGVVQAVGIDSSYGRSKHDMEDEWDNDANQGVRRKMARKIRERLRSDLLLPKNHTPTIYELKKVAQVFLATRDTLTKDLNTPLIVEKLKTASDINGCGTFKHNLMRLIDGEDNSADKAQSSHQDSDVRNNSTEEADNDDVKKTRYNFEELVRHANFSEELSAQEFQSWMEKSHVNCVLTGNVIRNAKEVVECLNKIISPLLIGLVFILWLILTGLASTQVLVLIVSPLLATTFIFGDSCKSFFQGVIFVYVVHPFDVGDLCTIDGKLMEVKSIGVWQTVFSNVARVGAQEETIFPNSELATKVVINHKSEIDCTDYLEFNLKFQDDEKIEILIRKIEEHLNHDDSMFQTGSDTVGIITTENQMKIAVRVGHRIDLKDVTYFECFRMKDKRRTAFILFVQNLLKKLPVESAEQAPDETLNSGDLSTTVTEIQPDRTSELK